MPQPGAVGVLNHVDTSDSVSNYYIYIFIYIIYPFVRRALNLLRASFSPIFQYFSAVNDTRVSFSPIFHFNISELVCHGIYFRTCMPWRAPWIRQPWKLGAVRSHRNFRVRRSVVHRALNWLTTSTIVATMYTSMSMS